MTNGSDAGWFLVYEERRIDLREGEVTLGRSRGCGVVLRDPSVSRGHALLSVRQGRVTLQDLRSSNGTYVNGKRLDKETVLEEGDRLVVGETELFLRRVGDGGGEEERARRIETGEVSLFCPACGLPIHGPAGGRCPGCGAELGTGQPPPTAGLPIRGPVPAPPLGTTTNAGNAGKVAASAGSDSWGHPDFQPQAARSGERAAATPLLLRQPMFDPPSDPPSSADPAPTAETRPRDASGAIAPFPLSAMPARPPMPPMPPMPPEPAEAPTPPSARPEPERREGTGTVASSFPSLPPPAVPTGLWSRLTGYLRGRRE
jgi:pilus assembly protein CpaF